MKRSPAQQRVWRHNGLRGSAKMVEAILLTIMKSPTASANAKHFASEMFYFIEPLKSSLQTRVDP